MQDTAGCSSGIDWGWLVEKSRSCLSAMGAVSYDDAVDHAQKVQTMLSSSISEMELQSELFDLIGESSLHL